MGKELQKGAYEIKKCVLFPPAVFCYLKGTEAIPQSFTTRHTEGNIMALSNLYSWKKNVVAKSMEGSACGSSDKLLGAACGSGDKLVGAACGSGDKLMSSACGSGDK